MGYSDLITGNDALPLVPTEQTAEIIKSAREQSVIMRLGRQLPNLSRKTRTLKVESSLAMVYGVNGSSSGAPGLKQTSTTDWSDVVLTAEEIAVIVPIPQETIDDSTVPIWPEVREQVAQALGAYIDSAAYINGEFTSWPTGGIRAAAVAAGNSLAIGTGADIYDDILGETAAGTAGLFGKVEADGYEVTGCVGAISMKSRMRGLRDTLGNPIFNKVPGGGMGYELDGAPCLFPKNGAFPTTDTNLIVGDWSMIVWAIRQELQYKLLTEGVITDAAGNIVLNLAQQDMVALRVTFRWGYALPNPANLVQTTAASRCPFGVLTT